MSFLSATISNLNFLRRLPVNFIHIYLVTNPLFVFFIAEKPSIVRLLFCLRHDALHVLNVQSCRVNFFSGFYIGFYFVTFEQCFKFLNLDYSFSDFFGLILFKKQFLNCSFSRLNNIFWQKVNYIQYLMYIWYIFWIIIVLSIVFFLGCLISNFFFYLC